MLFLQVKTILPNSLFVVWKTLFELISFFALAVYVFIDLFDCLSALVELGISWFLKGSNISLVSDFFSS